MDWDKKVYPRDVWNWIKDHLPYWPWDITGGLVSIFKKYMIGAKAHSRTGGFTPRRSVSRVDRGYFSDSFFVSAQDAINATKEVDDLDDLDRAIQRRMNHIDEQLKQLDDEDRWAMENYELAERTGLWSTNMADSPVIDGESYIKIERERK